MYGRTREVLLSNWPQGLTSAELVAALGDPYAVSTTLAGMYLAGELTSTLDDTAGALRWQLNDNPARDRVRFYTGPGEPIR